MIKSEKKQTTEIGKLLQEDHNGSFRQSLKERLWSFKQETDKKIAIEQDREELKRLEAFQRAIIIAERILEKVLVEVSEEKSF